MKRLRGWDILTRTQVISVLPALLLTLLLTAFFICARFQSLHEERDRTGQLIADQLAAAAEFGVLTGNLPMLNGLLKAGLGTARVRFLEIRDRQDNILAYAENAQDGAGADDIALFNAMIHGVVATPGRGGERSPHLGRAVIGLDNGALGTEERNIVLTAIVIAALALVFTSLLARRLACQLTAPIRAMSQAVQAIRDGRYETHLPEVDDHELGRLAQHINQLADGLAHASQEQQQSITQLTQARIEAERASRAKSDFLAMMSHELRTPMNGVLGMLQLLETTELNSEQAEYAALAWESTEHLLKVINDILDFSRIERDALDLERIAFNPLELVESSVQVFRHSAQQRRLELVMDTQPGLDDFEAQGDPTRIRQILVNLIGNALKFTEEGSIRVSTRWQALDNQVLWFSCSVQDSGIGVSTDQLERMFDAFQQADSSISRRFGGTGLGLPIARNLAERMGGTLRAQSQPGRGSEFILEIPLPFTPRTIGRQGGPQLEALGEGEEVLLVEDNPVNQTVIEAMLRSLGYRVDLVADGAQAVCHAARKRYAVILMDCRLPSLDGYEATRQIRSLEELDRIPIIALTANALQGDRERCLAAGMNDYLAKPFKRADLQSVLQRWLQPATAMEKQ